MRYLALALAIGAPLLASPSHGQVDPRATAALARTPAWRNSVVYITIRCPGGAPDFGAGVVINDRGYVVTAAHVGKSCLTHTSAGMGRITSVYTSPGETIQATLIERRVNGAVTTDLDTINKANSEDIALWRIANFNASGLSAAKRSHRFQVPGEPVSVVGFSGLPFSYPANPHGERPGLTINRLSLSSVAAREPTQIPYRLHYPGTTLAGVSGGPVFDEAGELIGIHSTRVTTNVRDLIETGCTVDQFNNCAVVGTYPGAAGASQNVTLGVNFKAVKLPLENYSWATSVHAIPDDWFTRQ